MFISNDEQVVSSSATKRKQRKQQPPLWVVAVRYILAATVAVLLTVACPDTRLWIKTTTGGGIHLHVKHLVEVLLVYILSLGALFSVLGSDPGYLHADTTATTTTTTVAARAAVVCQDHDDDDDDGLTLLLGYEQQDKQENVSLESLPDALLLEEKSSLELRVKGTTTTTRRKQCPSCGLLAPPLRSHHCRICNKCVATFDHHCIFIGTCIGERNHCRFWWFLSMQLVGFCTCCRIVSSSTLTFLPLQQLREAGQSSSSSLLLLLVAKLYLYPLTITAAILWVMHTIFAITNLTTFECSKGPNHIDYLRGTRQCDLPFSQVCVREAETKKEKCATCNV